MALGNVPRCQHIKVNGTQCGSPAMYRRRLCFFHRRAQEQKARITQDQFKQARFVLPVLEDPAAVQMALMQVLQMLAWGEMEPKIAGLMLYGLQTASANLRYADFEAEEPTDVVIHPEDVSKTDIGGPQWDPDEFEEYEEELSEEGEPEEGTPEEVVTVLPVAAEGAAEGAAEVVGKIATKIAPKVPATMEEAREQVRGLIHEWVLDSVEGKARRQLGVGG